MESKSDEKPGTSASLYSAVVASRESSHLVEESMESEGDQSQDGNSSSVKVRNASRDRPEPDKIHSKRLKVSDEDDNDDEDNDPQLQQIGQRTAMDTDSSDDEVDDAQVVEDTVMEERSSEPEPQHHFQSSGNIETGRIQSRRSSTADQDVSTTMQPSSLRHDNMFTSGERRDSHFVVDQAVASTSAAAMAPPLSRIMEESPALNDLYRQSAMYSSEDLGGASRLRRSQDRVSAPSVGGRQANLQRFDNVDVNENRDPEEFLQKMHGKQRLMWARKLFFVSTELVFPGFTAYSDNKSKMADYLGVRVRSSCAMQALLYADALFFIMWILSFLSTCQILITVLKQLHGYLSVCLTCLFIIVNAIRLRFGLKGNENDEVQYLALFWMITVIVQIPLFTFIFLTDLFCPVLMAFTVTMDGAMMLFILLESVVGFIHFRSLLRDELNIIKMARRSKEARASTTSHQRAEDPSRAPSNQAVPPTLDARIVADPNESESSNTDSENDHHDQGRMERESMDFRMQIRRVSESQRAGNNNQDDSASDSSEQVTSTSDTVRQRPIRAH